MLRHVGYGLQSSLGLVREVRYYVVVYTADCDAEGATWLQFFFECKFVSSRVSEFFLRQRANCTPSRAAPPWALR